MVIKNALIMHLGNVNKNQYLTKECVLNSIETFINKSIVYDDGDPYNFNYPAIGYIIGNVNIIDDEVRADINIKDDCINKWSGKYTGWCLQPNIKENRIDLSNIHTGGIENE